MRALTGIGLFTTLRFLAAATTFVRRFVACFGMGTILLCLIAFFCATG